MVKCDHCNTENDENATECKECGEKIASPKATQSMDKKIWKVLGITVLVLVVGAVIFIALGSGESSLPEFDQTLIKSVENGESAQSLVARINDNAQLNRESAKSAYEDLLTGNQSESSSGFQSQVQADYQKQLDYIQKIQDVQLKFVNGQIDKATFMQQIKQVYAQKPDMDY